MDSPTLPPTSSPILRKAMVVDASRLSSYDRQRKISQWIDDIDQLDIMASQSSADDTEHDSAFSSIASRSGRVRDDTTHATTVTTPSILDDEDTDPEDDFVVEAAQQALARGRESFRNKDYTGATAYLAEVLTMIKGLTTSQQAICDTWELRRMLGVCAFHVNEPIDAEPALLSVLDNAPKNAGLSQTQRLEVSEIAHLLSQTYVRLGSLDQSYRYCEYALRGRRRVLGKSHAHSFDSLALMARILHLQDNDLRAEFFLVMIPADVREMYSKRYARLTLPGKRLSADRPVASVLAPVIPIEHSLQLTMEEMAGPAPDVPARRRPRPASNISGRTNRVSSVGSDAGDGSSTVSSVSPITPSESPFNQPKPFTSPPSRPLPGPPRSVPDSITVQQDQRSQERSVNRRGPSDLPYRPRMSVVNENMEPQFRQHQSSDSSDSQSTFVQHPAFRPTSPIANLDSFPPVPVRAQAPPTPPSSQPAVEEKSLVADVSDIRPTLSPLPPPSLPDGSSLARPYTPSNYSQEHSEARPSRPASIRNVLSRNSSEQQDSKRSKSFLKRIGGKSSEKTVTTSTASNSVNAAIPQTKPPNPSPLAQFAEPTPQYSSVIRLSKHDQESIKGDVLTENVVDFWQDYLETTMTKGSVKITFLRPMRALLLQTTADAMTVKAAALPDFKTTMHVMIPVKNPHRPHWSLLLISRIDELACHYDPFKGRNSKVAKQIAERISKHTGQPLKYLDVPDTPEQYHEQDSGVLVCMYMQHLVGKLQGTHISQKVDATLQMKAVDVKTARKGIGKIAEERLKKEKKADKKSKKGVQEMTQKDDLIAYPYGGHGETVTTVTGGV